MKHTQSYKALGTIFDTFCSKAEEIVMGMSFWDCFYFSIFFDFANSRLPDMPVDCGSRSSTRGRASQKHHRLLRLIKIVSPVSVVGHLLVSSALLRDFVVFRFGSLRLVARKKNIIELSAATSGTFLEVWSCGPHIPIDLGRFM